MFTYLSRFPKASFHNRTTEPFSVESKALKGMEWNDAALDVWITNPQKWVPGVYMFYKQQDPEVRRKIIHYLKANP